MNTLHFAIWGKLLSTSVISEDGNYYFPVQMGGDLADIGKHANFLFLVTSELQTRLAN